MITNFEEYSINEFYRFYKKIPNYIINIAFNKAVKHFNDIHEKITEEHVIEFVIHFINHNYGVDISHIKEPYKYIKTYIHSKFLNLKK